MSFIPRAHRTPLTVAVLSLLNERARHPYEMQATIRERGVGRVVKLRGGSLYDAIARLERLELVRPRETTRAGARPARTVYEITAAGRAEVESLLRELLSEPAREYPRFPAALAHVLNLPADEVASLLRRRSARLATELQEIEGELTGSRGRGLPGVVVIEVEYEQAMRRAEITWLQETVGRIEDGSLEWLGRGGTGG